jgi:hypothetical protein
MSIRQIADRLGRSPATVKAYFYDPTGEKARAVKARYVGVCRGCGAYTQPRNGKGDAHAYCKICHPGAIERRWTRERVLDAMRTWRDLHGLLPSSYDWSRTHARRRGGDALERLAGGGWPAASVVTAMFGTWDTARVAASEYAWRRKEKVVGSSPTEALRIGCMYPIFGDQAHGPEPDSMITRRTRVATRASDGPRARAATRTSQE